jgi:hypothetical protein
MKVFMFALISFMFVGLSFAEPPSSSTDKNGHYWCHFDSVHGSDCNTCQNGQMSHGPFNREPNCSKVCEATAEGTNCSSATMTRKPGKGPTATPVREKAAPLNGKKKTKKAKLAPKATKK